MSRPPLEDALPAAYPSPALEPEREKILHARLDETFAEARAEAARRESKRARTKRNPVHIALRMALIGSFTYIAQSLIASVFLFFIGRYDLPNSPNISSRIVVYKFHNSNKSILLEQWVLKQNSWLYKPDENSVTVSNSTETFQLKNETFSKVKTSTGYSPQRDTVASGTTKVFQHAYQMKPYFLGFRKTSKGILFGIRDSPFGDNIWFDVVTRRVSLVNIHDGYGKLLYRQEYTYGETPPPGIFDPERLKAMAKRAHSTAPTRPR